MISLIGLPRSGKSSFLAALQHLLATNEVSTNLRLTRFSGNMAHANALVKKWQSGTPFERTSTAKEGAFSFFLKVGDDSDEFEISLPDPSGERFQQIAGNGVIDASFFEKLVESDGILLFVDVQKQFEDLTISQMQGQFGPPVADNQEPNRTVVWDPTRMPEQAQLLVILNAMNRFPLAAKKRRIAVVLSAWDSVGEGIDPSAWLMEHRPMLARYLENNPDLFEVVIFGVSAWGADPEDEAARAKIKKTAEASRRIKVVQSGIESHDLSWPVRWLIEQR